MIDISRWLENQSIFSRIIHIFFHFYQSPSWAETSATSPSVVSSSSKLERVFTSLYKDMNGSLGFSISGGRGKEQFIEGDDSVYISKVAEAGPAHRFVLLLRWRFVMKLTQSVTFMTSLCQSMHWKLSISIFWEIFSWLVAILPDRTRRISPSRRKSEKNSISFTSKTA